MIRAVLEGVAANSAWLFRYVEKFAGQSLAPSAWWAAVPSPNSGARYLPTRSGARFTKWESHDRPNCAAPHWASSVALGRRTIGELDDVPTPAKVFTPTT